MIILFLFGCFFDILRVIIEEQNILFTDICSYYYLFGIGISVLTTLDKSMSTYTSRKSIPSCSNPLTSSKYRSSNYGFNKNKAVEHMFLDKKTIVKRLQKLMLDVKDLDTKMFVSKTISYIEQNPCITTTDIIKVRDPNLHGNDSYNQKENSDLFSNQCSNVKIIANSAVNSMTSSMLNTLAINSLNNESILSIQNQSKFLSETATSEGFFQTTKNHFHNNNPVIQQTLSEAGTIQCECGLFQNLLKMMQKLMDCGVLKAKQQSENEVLQINDLFIAQITEQLIKKFTTLQTSVLSSQVSYKSYQQSITLQLVTKQSQNMQLTEQIKRLNQQFYALSQKSAQCDAHHSQFQKQIFMLRRQKKQMASKLSACLKQIEQHTVKRFMIQENKNKKHQINALKFQIELKDNQIVELKTVIEVLEKGNKDFGREVQNANIKNVQLMRQKQEQTRKQREEQRIVVCYRFDVPESYEKSSNQINPKDTQPSAVSFVAIQSLKLQNSQLRQQCILLYEKLNHFQLFHQTADQLINQS